MSGLSLCSGASFRQRTWKLLEWKSSWASSMSWRFAVFSASQSGGNTMGIYGTCSLCKHIGYRSWIPFEGEQMLMFLRRMPLFIHLVWYLSNEAGNWAWTQNRWKWMRWMKRMKSVKWTELHAMKWIWKSIKEMDETNGHDGTNVHEWNGWIQMELHEMDGIGWNGWIWMEILSNPPPPLPTCLTALFKRHSLVLAAVKEYQAFLTVSNCEVTHCVSSCHRVFLLLCLCALAPLHLCEKTSEIRIARVIRVTTEYPVQLTDPFNKVPGPGLTGLTARQRR